MRPEPLIGLTMPGSPGRKVCAICSIKDRWTRPIAIGAPTQRCRLIKQLIEPWRKVINELELKNRTVSSGGKANGCSDNSRFSKRRVHSSPGIACRETLGKAENAALRVFYVFAEQDRIWKTCERLTETKIQGTNHCDIVPIDPEW